MLMCMLFQTNNWLKIMFWTQPNISYWRYKIFGKVLSIAVIAFMASKSQATCPSFFMEDKTTQAQPTPLSSSTASNVKLKSLKQLLPDNSMMLKVRDEIILILSELHLSAMEKGKVSIYPMDNIEYSRLLSSSLAMDLSHVAFDKSNKVIGFSLAYFYPERGSIVLEKLAVKEESQGQGLSKQLLNRLAQSAKANTVDKIELHVYKRNSNAIAVYEHLSFINSTPGFALTDPKYNAFLFSTKTDQLLKVTNSP